MAVSAHLFDSFLINALGSGSAGGAPNCDLLSDDIYCALITSVTPPVQETHDFWNDLVATEVANGNGYTTNGIIQANKTLANNTHVTKFDNTVDPAWTSSTITARYAIVVDRTPATDATRPLIGYVDFGQDVSSSNGTFTITWSASGIFTITMS